MPKLEEKYITNKAGKRVGIVIDIKEYERMLEAIEELGLIKAYDEAMASEETARPLDEVCKDVERRHR